MSNSQMLKVNDHGDDDDDDVDYEDDDSDDDDVAICKWLAVNNVVFSLKKKKYKNNKIVMSSLKLST